MSRYLFVGDLHGKVEIMNCAFAMTAGTDIVPVFMGDYVDSFNASIMDQLVVLDAVLDAAENGNAIALIGNHELSYIDPRTHSATGRSVIMDTHLISRRSRMIKFLQNYTFLDGWLVTHAGVSGAALAHYDATLEEYLESNAIHDIGRARGGRAYCGGIFWCDWFREFMPIDVPQVVGHTTIQEGHIDFVHGGATSFNVDCFVKGKDPEFLLLENGNARIVRCIEDIVDRPTSSACRWASDCSGP